MNRAFEFVALTILAIGTAAACKRDPANSPRISPTGLGYVAPQTPRTVPDDGWNDPAPHRALGVNVAPGVRLHVLDFGGTGTPLVFLSGIGNNAHVFDDFAQRFTRGHRVIAITRRGFGESSHPPGGYDQATLAADIHAVLDTLGISRALLAGHSIGGYEITHFAARYPDRVIGLIYLDAGYDAVAADSIQRSFAPSLAILSTLPYPPAIRQVMPEPEDSASPKAAWAYRQRVGLIDNTESAVRAAYFYEGFNPYLGNYNPAPVKIEAAIAAGERTPFARVHAPAIFIFAARDSVRYQPAGIQEWIGEDAARRKAVQHALDIVGPVNRAQREYVSHELRGSRMVTMQGARHLIFLTHPDQVERYMNEFMAGLR
ncbi:MAG: alpha/beta hydrolase [Gemmatimonadota bacterium]|nr:alpha/beta hydrolase [Gemmatimonadota bacterium]